jgi:hypothetical protein
LNNGARVQNFSVCKKRVMEGNAVGLKRIGDEVNSWPILVRKCFKICLVRQRYHSKLNNLHQSNQNHIGKEAT